MPPQSEHASQQPPSTAEDTRWPAWHLFHDEDLDGLLWEVARPLIRQLLAEGLADSFFFIRYPEGGNHIRLRLHCAPGQPPGPLEQRTEALLAPLTAAWKPRPSTRSPAPAPLSVRRAPFEPELERYGGQALLPLSLDFFTLSSVDALRFVEQWGGQPRSRQLPETLRRLLAQALGLARDWPEALGLLDYFAGRKPEMQAILARADQAFEARQEPLVLTFRNHLQGWLEQGPALPVPPVPPSHLLAEAGRALAAALTELAPAARETVKASQMHMTANRLGLLNAEESYLTRLMCRCAEAVEAREPQLVRDVDAWLRGRHLPERPAERLSQLLASELAAGLASAPRETPA